MDQNQKSMSKQNRKEMQEKVNKQYIDQKINLIIEPMAAALFTTGAGQDPVSLRIRLLLTLHIPFRLSSCLNTLKLTLETDLQ